MSDGKKPTVGTLRNGAYFLQWVAGPCGYGGFFLPANQGQSHKGNVCAGPVVGGGPKAPMNSSTGAWGNELGGGGRFVGWGAPAIHPRAWLVHCYKGGGLPKNSVTACASPSCITSTFRPGDRGGAHGWETEARRAVGKKVDLWLPKKKTPGGGA